MSQQTNCIVLRGNLVRSPEVKMVGEHKVASFRLANNRGWGEKKKALFIDVSAWRKTADFIEQYVASGAQVIVTGALEMREYEDKEGNKRTVYQINAQEVELVGGKPKEEGVPAAESEEGLPF